MELARSQRNQFDRLPPQDLDAERGVLGSVLTYGECLDDVSPILTPEMFYLDAHVLIFKAMTTMRERGMAIDATTVATQLERTNHLGEIGDRAYLIKCLESVPHSAHAKYYASIVRDKYTQRMVIYSCTEILSEAYAGFLDTPDLLAKIDESFNQILEKDKQEQAQPISHAALRAMARHTSPVPEGITFGYRDIDGIANRFKPGQVIILAARPGVGKSAMAVWIARHVAQFSPVFIASLEMTSDELIYRMTATMLEISLDELKVWANDERRDRVNDALNEIDRWPIVVNEAPEQSVASIAAQCRQMKRRGGLGLVIVDYLQLLTPYSTKDSREVQVSKISNGLRGLAKSLGVPILALAQLNRDIEKRPEKTPRLADLRESGAIEQNAHVILFLDRPHIWDPANKGVNEAIVTVAKNRGGRTGRVDLYWNPRSATFTDQKTVLDGFNADDVFNDIPPGLDVDIDFGP